MGIWNDIGFIKNADITLLLYSLILLWINIGYIREYKKIKKGLQDIQSEDELDVNPNSFSILIIQVIFNFFRSWMFYIIAILITGHIIVVLIAAVLFLIDAYQTLLGSSLAQLKKSNVKYYHAIADTVFIIGIVGYYFLFLS